MFSLLVFIVITVLLIMRLNDILGMNVGFKVDVRKNDTFSEDSSIEEVNRDKDKVNIKDMFGNYADFVPHDFLDKSKKAFEIIFEAYAEGDKRTLKDLLAPKLCNAFSMAIDDRNSRGEKLEGILVRFISADITDVSANDEDVFVTVKFITEQSNVLKDRNGMIIEGNSDFVENRTDTWIFCRKKNSISSTWLLYEIIDA
jgi:predicted lipid-binding transport protein (Tim44 family)